MPRHRRNINGYSMMELLIVIAIVSIVAALARPSVKPYLESMRLRSAANAVKQQLVLAKTRALGDANLHTGVYFNTVANPDITQPFIDNNNNNQYDSGPTRFTCPPLSFP